MKIVKIIICALFGLFFIIMGLNKFMNFMPVPKMTPEQMDMMGAIMKIKWLMPLVGTAEVLGGLLFAIPKTRALGAIVIFPVMVGILLHDTIIEPSAMPIAAVLMLINLWMIGDNWKKYQPMIN